MTVTGVFIDAQTGKPVPGITVDFYPDGNMSNDPYATFSSDANGNYSYTSALIDTETSPLFSAYGTGYAQQIGPPASFQGSHSITEDSDATGGTSISGITIVVIALAIFAIWYFKLYKKF